MTLNNSPASNVRMCTAIGSHNRTLPTNCTLPQTIPAQPSIKALAIKALGRTTNRTLSAHCIKAVPLVSKLCCWLQIDPVEVFAQELFDGDDLLLYELGTYTTQQIIIYLVSWQLGGCTVPFALIKTDALLAYISKLPTDNQRMITAWLTVNIKEITGGANG